MAFANCAQVADCTLTRSVGLASAAADYAAWAAEPADADEAAVNKTRGRNERHDLQFHSLSTVGLG
jgi:hypothetical protein